MKVRAQKANYNTQRSFDDFLVKEFSLDKEVFVVDPNLSCNHCYPQENVSLHQDSTTSFLIKYKASLLPEPGCIKPGAKGYILPEQGYVFKLTASNLLFTSINQNHYEMSLNSVQAQAVAQHIYHNAGSLIDIPKAQITDYIIDSCQQTEWNALYQSADRKNWKNHLRKKLREKYKNAYGAFDDSNISQSCQIDPSGIGNLVSVLRSFEFLETSEEQVLQKYIP